MRRRRIPAVQIGDRVRIGEGTDETFDSRFRRKTGIVKRLDYSCGCGQSYPDDPMIGVSFPDGQYEEFWTEELEIIG